MVQIEGHHSRLQKNLVYWALRVFVWADAAVKTGAWQRRRPPRIVCFSTKRKQRARGAPPHAEECTKEGPRARHRRRRGRPNRGGGESIIVSARPRRAAFRCPACGRRCDGYDTLPARRWRAPDVGSAGATSSTRRGASSARNTGCAPRPSRGPAPRRAGSPRPSRTPWCGSPYTCAGARWPSS